ncbi:unnamed protein product [Rhizoctonia solani]|uniref:Uncharacterized protein n=1 Tax=Rhizoctonia solani TaxID=456999 RepID=A0A8H3CM61_9AGAM|nr:hypothetical protein RHS04_05773 [Rhizoctonia solani]CAE6487827.1 unnamed protein product [Rhizoctonia solani]
MLDASAMIPVPSSSQQPLKPILKRSGSNTVTKSVTFSATNSQVFFADDWDRSAVEVVSKLSYSDVLELKQLSLESLPSDRHASMGLSPLLSHVPLTLCPLTCEEPKNSSSSSTESRAAAPPSSSASSSEPKASPLVVPDLSILASPVPTSSAVPSVLPRPPLSPVSSDAGSSASVSMGSVSPRTTSDSSPESTPPKISVQLTAPVPVRRQLMMSFQPLLPEPGAELPPSPVLSASSLSDSSTDTGKTLSILLTQDPMTPTTPRTPHTPSQLSPIPASPISPTSFVFGPAPTQGSSPNKSRSSRAADSARSSALLGPKSGDFGQSPPTKSAAGNVSPVSPISPASDKTVSVASELVRPVPRRAYTPVSDIPSLAPSPQTSLVRRASLSSAPDLDPVQRTKGSRGFDESRGTKRLAIAASAWVDGALPSHKEELETSIPTPIEPNLRSVPLPPAPTPSRSLQRSNSLNESQPRPFKYTNPYSQIRESDESTSVGETTPRLHTRRASSDRAVQLTRDLPAAASIKSTSLALPNAQEDSLGLSIAPRARPPPVSMSRPVPAHRASVHGYPVGTNRPPSPTPQAFSRGYPSPLSPNPPLSHQQPQLQSRSGKPLATKDANANRPLLEPRSASYTLSDSGKGANLFDRKPRSASDLPLVAPPAVATYSAPLGRPKNSKVSR